MDKLVRLWKRPSRDGRKFSYVLIYRDELGKTRYESLGHTDRRKAEQQRTKKQRDLRMGAVELGSMRLSELLADSLMRTRGRIRDATMQEYDSAMKQFIEIVGDIDCCSVRQGHAERFIQACLESGNRPATVAKKVGSLKRLFNLTVQRRQLDESPFRFVSKPKAPQCEVHIYTDQECERLIGVAGELQIGAPVRWDILILTALCTGMRRGELLNTIWRDVDFAGQKVQVTPKEDSEYTWAWDIKDSDRRGLPLTDEVLQLLAEHQAAQPEGYPYVFVPPKRYDRIQGVRRQGEWTTSRGRCPLGNFRSQFTRILSRAGIDRGTFHDLRRTCITNWFAHGLSEFEVMIMAGHASFETTRRFYLAVRGDIIERARQASSEAMKGISIAHALRAPS